MRENMNINQVEKITGVSKRNIRFYEKEGLLLPKRNSENGYRVYDEADIWRIKVIKMLRMLDMPLEEIKKVLEEEQMLSVAVVNQQLELERKAKELQAAISFCEQLKETELDSLDVDGCLNYIESAGGEGFFTEWVHDYKYVVEMNRDMDFSFTPEYPIITARHFTEALFEYANENNLNLVITKEGLYPEFTIDGVEYTAMRYTGNFGGVPHSRVLCQRKDREIKGDGVAEPRKLLQWFIHRWGGLVVVFILYTVLFMPGMIKDGMIWESILAFVSPLILLIAMTYRDLILHFNDKTK